MSPAKRLWGEPVAAPVREAVVDRIDALETPPTLGTVLMSDDPVDEMLMGLKHTACEATGIETRECRLDPTAEAARLYRAVVHLSEDSEVDAVFVQIPLPDHVALATLRERVDPRKDIDCFHPANLGRLVTGEPRFVPATAAAIRYLLRAYEIPVESRTVAVVGRSATIGIPTATLFSQDGPGTDATVISCHSRARDLGAMTRRADIIVSVCGVPELIDGSMLSPGATVIDVGSTQVDDDGFGAFGDVDHKTARTVAGAITPVPGGVGPVTVAMVLRNVVLAAERRSANDPGDR